MNKRTEQIETSIEVGDILLTNSGERYLVTNTIAIATRSFLDDNYKETHSVIIESELHLFDIDNKELTTASYYRLNEGSILWVNIEVKKIIKRVEYSLKVIKAKG